MRLCYLQRRNKENLTDDAESTLQMKIWQKKTISTLTKQNGEHSINNISVIY